MSGVGVAGGGRRGGDLAYIASTSVTGRCEAREFSAADFICSDDDWSKLGGGDDLEGHALLRWSSSAAIKTFLGQQRASVPVCQCTLHSLLIKTPITARLRRGSYKTVLPAVIMADDGITRFG